jgi:hypothetical protein
LISDYGFISYLARYFSLVIFVAIAPRTIAIQYPPFAPSLFHDHDWYIEAWFLSILPLAISSSPAFRCIRRLPSERIKEGSTNVLVSANSTFHCQLRRLMHMRYSLDKERKEKKKRDSKKRQLGKLK